MNIISIFERFPTQADCIAHLERVRWHGSPTCPYCGSDRVTAMPKEARHHCNNCKTSFSVTVATIFHRTHLPLQKWLLAVSLVLNAKKGISSRQLARDIGVNKNTAWRMGMQIRDAMLAVSGKLNLKAGGESVMIPVEQELIDSLYKPDQWQVADDPDDHYRRSIYLVAKRNLRLPFMEVFDQPALLTACARRESSTHAPQALELLNGRTSNELAEVFAKRLRREVGTSSEQQAERAYLLAVGRMPTGQEKRLAVEFIENQPVREFALAMFNLNAFLYVN